MEQVYVQCYTRTPLTEQIYSPKLAYSMHLAYSENGKDFEPLNDNSGVLFALPTENSNSTINAKSLKNPFIFKIADGSFGIIAIRTEFDGSNDAQSKGSILLFTSTDLLRYQEIGLMNLQSDVYVEDAVCEYDAEHRVYVLRWRSEDGRSFVNRIDNLLSLACTHAPEPCDSFSQYYPNTGIDGMVPRNIVIVPQSIGERLKSKLTVPHNVKVCVPETVYVKSEAELQKIKATAYYSDGTTAEKEVTWQVDNFDWSQKGQYEIAGEICQEHFEFPIAEHRADPCVFYWHGKYYFIATNDADGNKSLFIRESEDFSGLVTAEEKEILNTKTYPHVKNFLWAPEFHVINEKLYIYHACSPGPFGQIHSHVMKLKENGNPTNATDWEEPIRVLKKDGSYLFEQGITLDMTCFELEGTHYVIWAQREFVPTDLGSWLYIATLNPDEPWKLAGDPVLMSKPEYGWANNHVFVDEGAYALITEKKVFISIACALVDATYCVGLMSIDRGSDLLNPKNWIKENYPLLTSRSVPGEYGPGHNAFLVKDNGEVYLTYHARPGIDKPRSSGIRRVHFDIDGYPIFGLTEEKDLNPAFKKVKIKINTL